MHNIGDFEVTDETYYKLQDLIVKLDCAFEANSHSAIERLLIPYVAAEHEKAKPVPITFDTFRR